MKYIGILISAAIFPFIAYADSNLLSDLDSTSFVNCSKIDQYKRPLLSDHTELGESYTLKKAVGYLLKHDLENRTKEFDYFDHLGALWREEIQQYEFEVAVKEYNETDTALQAQCLVDHFQDGDRVTSYVEKTKSSYRKGFLLLRKNKIIAIITEYMMVE